MNRVRLFRGLLAAGRGWIAGAGERGGWCGVLVQMVVSEGGTGEVGRGKWAGTGVKRCY